MNLAQTKVSKFVIAPLLATALVVPAGARPAHAAVDPSTIVAVITAVAKIFDALKGLRGGGKNVEQATTEIIAAVNASKTAIIAHADALAAAPAKACTTSAVIELADIGSLSPVGLERWAQEVTSCTTLVDSLHTTVADKAVADQLGFALNVVGPIALLARSRAGLQTAQLVLVLNNSNRSLQAKLAPACRTITTTLGTRNVQANICSSYPGAFEGRTMCLAGSPQCGNTELAATARRETVAKTSWSAAQIALTALAA